MIGWKCPSCGSCYNPVVVQCFCNKKNPSTTEFVIPYTGEHCKKPVWKKLYDKSESQWVISEMKKGKGYVLVKYIMKKIVNIQTFIFLIKDVNCIEDLQLITGEDNTEGEYYFIEIPNLKDKENE